MTFVIFIGDLLVMGFMTAVVVWVFVHANDDQIRTVANLPLEDDQLDG
jgi:cbb3-type cytochrome oxidase subunit 3